MRPYYNKTHQLSTVLDKVAKPCLKAHGGFYFAQMMLDWEKIVGEALAKDTLPTKLMFPKGQGTEAQLTLQVNPGAALMIGFQQGLIIERIAIHYGKRLVGKIALIQAPINRVVAVVKAQKPRQALPQDLLDKVNDIEDENLRQILKNLGEAILSDKNK